MAPRPWSFQGSGFDLEDYANIRGQAHLYEGIMKKEGESERLLYVNVMYVASIYALPI